MIPFTSTKQSSFADIWSQTKTLEKLEFWLDGRWKFKGSVWSYYYSSWKEHECVPNVKSNHPINVETFHSKP